MARFHVHRLNGRTGLVFDLQADVLDTLGTRVVAPVVPLSEVALVSTRLTPRIELDGRAYIILIPSMASLPRKLLGEAVFDLSGRQDEIVAATDFLFQGF